MARVTVEDCLEKVNNRFNLVLLAAKRARQLVKTAVEPTVAWDADKATVVALREIAAGNIGLDFLTKPTEDEGQLYAEEQPVTFASLSNEPNSQDTMQSASQHGDENTGLDAENTDMSTQAETDGTPPIVGPVLSSMLPQEEESSEESPSTDLESKNGDIEPKTDEDGDSQA